ncbi:MAG: hypothetical protein VX405_05905 [Myxococcota bacterium]|nr:hypothetical protein [Myxococcota bacterium]
MKFSSRFFSLVLTMIVGCPGLNLGEPGDNLGTAGIGLMSGAEMAVLEEEVGGELPEGGIDAADVYSIDLLAGHRLRVLRKTGEVDLNLLDAEGTDLRILDHGLGDLIELGSEAGGGYFLRVTSASGDAAFYTVELHASRAGQGEGESEPNNTSDLATDLGNLSEPMTISGHMDIEADRQDWFVVELNQGGDLELGWSRDQEPNGGFDLRVLDHDSGAVLAEDLGVASSDSSLTVSGEDLEGVRQLAVHLLWDAGTDPRYGSDSDFSYVLNLAQD